MNVTLTNIDFQDSFSVQRAIDILRHLEHMSIMLIGASEHMTFNVAYELPEEPEKFSLGNDTLAIYGKTTRHFIEAMLDRIRKNGSVTLEEVADDENISVETARAYLRNAGRTAAAHKVTLPFKPVWNHDKGVNDYSLGG